MSLETWKECVGEISTIIQGEPSREKIIGLAALVTLRSYFDAESSPCTQKENEPHDTLYHATEELSGADEYHRMGLNDIARDELRHAQYFLDILRKEAYTPEQQSIVGDLQAQHDLMAQMMG